MAWSNYKSLDELADIPLDEATYLIQRYIQRLRHIDIEKDVKGFVDSVKLFYKVNDIIIDEEVNLEHLNT